MRTTFIRIAIVLVSCGLFWSKLCVAAELNGILKIQGKHVKYLVLNGKDREVFEEPNQVIKLPVGSYNVSEVKLQRDYVSHPYNLSSIKIKEGETTVLKIGGPLTQNVDVKRRGNSLQLNYKLQGIGGEIYTSSTRIDPPRCAIYNGDKEIANFSFKYG